MPQKKERKKYEYRTYPVKDPETGIVTRMTVLQACQKYGKTYSTVNTRLLRNNGDLQKALFKPVQKHAGANPTEEWRRMTRKCIPHNEMKKHWDKHYADLSVKSSC